jgi:hypothetical protein
MKMLLHKMTLVETRIQQIDQSIANSSNSKKNERKKLLRTEYEHELNYYDTYVTELKNVFIHTNNIRSQYQNKIHACLDITAKLERELQVKENAINNLKMQLPVKFKEFHAQISKISRANAYLMLQSQFDSHLAEDEMKANANNNNNNNNSNNNRALQTVHHLPNTLELKNKKLEEQFDLLSFRISTIPANNYALRVLELCQLSFIYNNEKLKSFFEWFIKFAVQLFLEIIYASTMFQESNTDCINNELPTLQSIQYIAQITPALDLENKTTFDRKLQMQVALIMKYLALLPAEDERDSVIFHVARNLAGHITRSETILQTNENEIPTMAREDVKRWISTILVAPNANFQYSKDMSQIDENLIERDIIAVTEMDSEARVRPSRAAAIVLDHVYGIHVHG